jgi:carbon storage regulator CsrA
MPKVVTQQTTANNSMSRLVLSRKQDEEVIIHKDDEIIMSIRVSKIGSNQVRLAFDANLDIEIDREEIYKGKHVNSSSS